MKTLKCFKKRHNNVSLVQLKLHLCIVIVENDQFVIFCFVDVQLKAVSFRIQWTDDPIVSVFLELLGQATVCNHQRFGDLVEEMSRRDFVEA